MASVASAGMAERIAARTLFNVLRAGSGTPARYSSTLLGSTLPFAAEPRAVELVFFMRVILQGRFLQIYSTDYRAGFRRGMPRRYFLHGDLLGGLTWLHYNSRRIRRTL